MTEEFEQFNVNLKKVIWILHHISQKIIVAADCGIGCTTKTQIH